MYSYGPPHMAKQKQDDQLEHTYSSYVRIRDVALKTCQRRWMIGRSDERGSEISMLAAWHDDDDDDETKADMRIGDSTRTIDSQFAARFNIFNVYITRQKSRIFSEHCFIIEKVYLSVSVYITSYAKYDSFLCFSLKLENFTSRSLHWFMKYSS